MLFSSWLKRHRNNSYPLFLQFADNFLPWKSCVNSAHPLIQVHVLCSPQLGILNYTICLFARKRSLWMSRHALRFYALHSCTAGKFLEWLRLRASIKAETVPFHQLFKTCRVQLQPSNLNLEPDTRFKARMAFYIDYELLGKLIPSMHDLNLILQWGYL